MRLFGRYDSFLRNNRLRVFALRAVSGLFILHFQHRDKGFAWHLHEPNWRMRFLPSFCFSSSFFLRVISPP